MNHKLIVLTIGCKLTISPTNSEEDLNIAVETLRDTNPGVLRGKYHSGDWKKNPQECPYRPHRIKAERKTRRAKH